MFHHIANVRTLRELVRSYVTLVQDATRLMLRIKALFRARGISVKGTRVYASSHRKEWLSQLNRTWRASARCSRRRPAGHAALGQHVCQRRAHQVEVGGIADEFVGAEVAATFDVSINNPACVQSNPVAWIGRNVLRRNS